MVFHVLAPIKLTSNTMGVSAVLNKTANGAIQTGAYSVTRGIFIRLKIVFLAYQTAKNAAVYQLVTYAYKVSSYNKVHRNATKLVIIKHILLA